MRDYNFQVDANVSSLLEDKDYEERKNTILRLLKAFQAENVRFGMCCSFNLFLRGIVDEFHDFDFLVDEQDVPKVEDIMKQLGATLVGQGGNGFCESNVYRHYQLERVDVDILAGFRLVTFNTEYLYEYNQFEIETIEIYEEERIVIPLVAAEGLYLLYYMMEGWQARRRYKRLLIGEYLEEGIKFPQILERGLKDKIPPCIKREVRRLLDVNGVFQIS